MFGREPCASKQTRRMSLSDIPRNTDLSAVIKADRASLRKVGYGGGLQTHLIDVSAFRLDESIIWQY